MVLKNKMFYSAGHVIVSTVDPEERHTQIFKGLGIGNLLKF